jgi:hypothetical protein
VVAVERVESVSELAARVAEDSELERQLKEDPEGTLRRVAAPIETDRWIYRMAVMALGATMLAVVVSALVLKLNDSEAGIPDALVAIGSGALGALAGLMTPFPTRRS